MHCTVYRLRRDGEKITPEEMRAAAVRGWLYWGAKSLRGPQDKHAFLLARENGRVAYDEVLPTLTQARLVRIEYGGLLLSGFEVRIDPWQQLRQSWWAVPTGQAPVKPESPIRP